MRRNYTRILPRARFTQDMRPYPSHYTGGYKCEEKDKNTPKQNIHGSKKDTVHTIPAGLNGDAWYDVTWRLKARWSAFQNKRLKRSVLKVTRRQARVN